MKFFESLAAFTAAEKKSAEDIFHELSLAVADGREPKIRIEDAHRALRELGQTQADVAAEAERILAQRKHKAQFERKPHYVAENVRVAKSLEVTREQKKAELKALEARFNQKLDGLMDEQREIYRQLDLCETARVKLEELSGRHRELVALYARRAEPIREIEGGQLSRDIRAAEAAVVSAKARVRAIEERRAGDSIGNEFQSTYGGPLADAQEELRVAESVLKRWLRERDKLQAQADAVQAQIDAVQEKTLAVA